MQLSRFRVALAISESSLSGISEGIVSNIALITRKCQDTYVNILILECNKAHDGILG